MDKVLGDFIWNCGKELINIQKHGISFIIAAGVFNDPYRKIFIDSRHTKNEERLFCIGKVEGKILTVRFTYRGGKIRIFGAGYWRRGRRYYEESNI